MSGRSIAVLSIVAPNQQESEAADQGTVEINRLHCRRDGVDHLPEKATHDMIREFEIETLEAYLDRGEACD